MSRIGKLPISLPKGVELSQKDNVITVKGPKGTLTQKIDERITCTVEDGEVKLARKNDDREERALHGLYRSLINNMILGVSEGFKQTLELVGVGFRVANTGQLLDIWLCIDVKGNVIASFANTIPSTLGGRSQPFKRTSFIYKSTGYKELSLFNTAAVSSLPIGYR